MADNFTVCAIGLPKSGKTTFMLAMCYQVTSNEIQPKFTLESFAEGDHRYVNKHTQTWLSAISVDRTYIGAEGDIAVNLCSPHGGVVRLTFPDLSGERFRKMWEDRECETNIRDILHGASGVMVFVHADTISQPLLVIEYAENRKALGAPDPDSKDEIAWKPEFATTQTKLVDIIQVLERFDFGGAGRPIAILLSAWDKVMAEGLTPSQWLEKRLPLLHQYLTATRLQDRWTVFGVSAQGGDYATDAEGLREMPIPSQRPKLIGSEVDTNDLTQVLEWLIRGARPSQD